MNRYTSLAIKALTNDAEFTLSGEDLNEIVWISKNVKTPTVTEIESKAAEIEQSEKDAKLAIQMKLHNLGLTLEEVATIFA